MISNFDKQTPIMKRLNDYYLIRQNQISQKENLKIIQAVKSGVFPPFSDRYKSITYPIPFQNVVQNEFTPLTHKNSGELKIIQGGKMNQFQQNSKINGRNNQMLKCFHQIKKENQKYKLGMQISKYIHITLFFQESLKILDFQNYNISGISTFYELKLRVLNQLSDQRLFISQYLQLYIDRSEVQINNKGVDERMEIQKYENRKPITILVFSTLQPILNPSHNYEPNHTVLLNKQLNPKSFQISNFSIEYQDKKITWIEKTDLSYINFCEIVTHNIEIYNLNKIGYFRIPNQGQKLNKKRLIKLVIPEELLILSINNEGNIDEDYLKTKIQEQCQLLNQDFQSIDISGGFYEYYQE